MTIEIKVCMGSACFAKGNAENLQIIKKYIDDNNLDGNVTIVGELCANKCASGPRIIVNEKEYTNITQGELFNILETLKS